VVIDMAKAKKKAKTKDKPALTLAREALKDSSQAASHQRQWRAYVREVHLARALIAENKTRRSQDKEIRKLRTALAQACDLAIDSADVIDMEGVCLDEEDSINFRADIAELRKLTQQPKAQRHVEREASTETKKPDDVTTVDERPKQICNCGSGQLIGDDGQCNDCRLHELDESNPLYQQYRDACSDKDRA
jgi:hypothetical protein